MVKSKIGLQLNQSEKETSTQNGKLASVSTRYRKKFTVSESLWTILWEFRHISGRVPAHYMLCLKGNGSTLGLSHSYST